MVDQPVKKEKATRREWDDDIPIHRHVGIAYLPVPPLEVNHRPFPVTAGNNVHASVCRRRLVEGDPYPYHRFIQGNVEVRLILVPGLFAPLGRFAECHVLKESGRIAEKSLQHGQEPGVVSQRLEALFILDKVHQARAAPRRSLDLPRPEGT